MVNEYEEPSEFSSSQDTASNEVVDALIIACANRIARHKIPSNDYEDVLQDARFNGWYRCPKEPIRNLHAYAYKITSNTCADYWRRYKRYHEPNAVMLSFYADSENHEECLIDGCSPDERIRYREHLAFFVAAIVRFPRRQRLASICHFKEQISNVFGDLEFLTSLFQQYGIDINDIEWPGEEKARHQLKVSLYHALKRLRKLEKDF